MSQLLGIRETILFIRINQTDTEYRSQGNPDIDSQIMQKSKRQQYLKNILRNSQTLSGTVPITEYQIIGGMCRLDTQGKST